MKKNKKKKRKVLSIIERNILHILPSPSHKSITSILYYYLSLSIKMAKFVVTGVLGGIAYLIASTSREEDIYRDKFRDLVRSMKGSDMNKFYSIMKSKKETEDEDKQHQMNLLNAKVDQGLTNEKKGDDEEKKEK